MYFADSSYDTSVNTFYHINYCQPDEACKKQFREEFMCRSDDNIFQISKGTFGTPFIEFIMKYNAQFLFTPKNIEGIHHTFDDNCFQG